MFGKQKIYSTHGSLYYSKCNNYFLNHSPINSMMSDNTESDYVWTKS